MQQNLLRQILGQLLAVVVNAPQQMCMHHVTCFIITITEISGQVSEDYTLCMLISCMHLQHCSSCQVWVQLLQKWSGLVMSWLQTVMRPACNTLCVGPNLGCMMCQSCVSPVLYSTVMVYVL